MKILKVEIEGFGPFSSRRSLGFSEKGLNIVYGGNESGKSTLVEAIYATIFGFEKKETEQKFESWLPSHGFTGLVESEVSGGTVKFFRDFSSNRVTVTMTENGKSKELFSGDASPRSRSEEKRAYAEVLREFFGFADGALARRTSVVRQLELETEFTPELRGLISGAGSTDYHGAIELLKSRFEDITVENPWGRVARRKMRAIEETLEALKKARAQMEEAEGVFARSARLGKESTEIQKEIEELRGKAAQKKELLGKMGRLVELQNNLKEKQRLLRSEHAAREDYEKVKKTCEGAREKLRREYPLFTDLKTEISSALSRAASIEESIGLAERELSEGEARLKAAPRPVSGRSIAVVSLGIFVVVLLVGALLSRLALAMILGALIAVSVVVAFFVVSRSRSRNLSGAPALEELRRKLSGLREEETRFKQEISDAFPEEETRARAVTLAMRELATQYGKFIEAGKTVEDFERQLLERQVRAVGEGYAGALNEAAIAETKLEQFLKEQHELLSLKDDPGKAALMATQSKTEIESVEKKLAELERNLTEARIEHARVSALPVGPPEVYQEEIERLEKSLSRLTLRRDAIKFAVRVLDECVAQYQADSIERVAERIFEVFDSITQGRYKAVRLSPELDPLIETSLDTEIGPEQVSTGTQDQLYFSMRIAMIEELSGEKGLPLILDDPFVNFDDQRLERARVLLADLVTRRDMQIIVFTHGDRHLAWGANVIRLA
jgi:DNA repair exonuclease SbcCD ATPase subunit